MYDNDNRSSGPTAAQSKEFLSPAQRPRSSNNNGGGGQRHQQQKKQTVPLSKKVKFLLTIALGMMVAMVVAMFVLMTPEFRSMTWIQIAFGGAPVMIAFMALFALSNTTAVDTFD
tara:strand:+ start:148 stop:492 length:345 start_codon:yes stop_codon:yes gene_type:complete